jgi:hypothetical protein
VFYLTEKINIVKLIANVKIANVKIVIVKKFAKIKTIQNSIQNNIQIKML